MQTYGPQAGQKDGTHVSATPIIPYEFNAPVVSERIHARRAAGKFLSDQGHSVDGWELLKLERILITGIVEDKPPCRHNVFCTCINCSTRPD